MASVARRNLFEDLPRFLVAQAGIVFAVSLVTIQNGILNGFTRSTTVLIDRSQVDVWVSAQEMVNLQLTLPIPAALVNEVANIEGVERTEPLITRSTLWRSSTGQISPIQMFGFDPNSQLFRIGPLSAGTLNDLNQPYTLIPDKANLDSLRVQRVGDTGTVNSLPARIVGLTQDTQSIASGTFVFTSTANANAFLTSGFTSSTNCQVLPQGGLDCRTITERTPQAPPQAPRPLRASDTITYVLVKAKPGQDVQALKQRIEATLPGIRAFTRQEMAQRNRNYWVQRTGIGFILGLGATVGVVVGMVVVGQILYSSVADHLKEFGTLKAMGASDWLIYRIILEQAVWMGIIGFIPSLGLCLALGAWTYATQGITILITPLTATGVLALTLGMCVGSALFAIQKVMHVDPAIVFKA
ncbi:MAG TPA: ABC transporter permease [Synechococcales cyanobacterium M55_K2018_004]|nr:ABC transporter permease [Synechococcales cyanobacterium M55_K2018_004]